MKNIIISKPELQTFQQRMGSAFLSIMSWLLWLYFLFPIFTLGAWLLGVKSLTDEIRWFGGYKTLLGLLLMYGYIILGIFVIWVLWSVLLAWFKKSHKGKSLPVVTDDQLAKVFGVDVSALHQARGFKKVTVFFDEHAQITKMQGE